MSEPRTIAAVSATSGTPTPIYTGTAIVSSSFVILKGLATVVLNTAALPSIGFNLGQQVTLWGFATATYFNGLTVTVTQNNPQAISFSFPTTHADVTSTSDTGNAAPSPVDKFRSVRIEIDAGASTHLIYVGDLKVSSSQYTAQLALATQLAVEFSGDNIDASRIFIDTDNTGTKAHVTLVQ